MHIHVRKRLPVLVAAILLHSPCVVADEQIPEQLSEQYQWPLSQEELRDITAQVMAKEPMLASSPGVKFAEGDRIDRFSEDYATVIYYPHYESAGIKEAFQVACSRKIPDTAWTCEDPTIRRYLTLDTQDFEVRVKGSITSEAAIAFIDASRTLLPVPSFEGEDVPDSAMMLSSYDGSATVQWVNFEGRAHLMVKGELAEGGDPARPEDWIVSAWMPEAN